MAGGLIHVGAWTGTEYLEDERRLLLFEPQSAAFKRLHLNLGTKDNVTLVNCALGAEVGRAEMFVTEPDHSSSLLEPVWLTNHHPHIKDTGKRETVKLRTLDYMVNFLDLDGFDEMVVDVQGYEIQVFAGATETLKGIERIKCEVATVPFYAGQPLIEDVDNCLEVHGFERTETDLYEADGQAGDAIYAK